ncbi:P-loop containing nucleoside triphosphate hydrolase protein [Yamadazyma tenuis ATCC 10573]|uniref:p-loop containing nucleoside triphosphate hydrolase protein n=2 Tax=Candida tenuis TaxID=2315449 RepID=G3AW48_CANTC|nr:P-loop containing nucleoside triphosphate hydrolase protein [Yamadazyma tenuis ATCC 10573]EGV66452.1 P-loop containing nucleoside triphosphate hydrolase protein [Yamadazyma tenuis ATCC 10573]
MSSNFESELSDATKVSLFKFTKRSDFINIIPGVIFSAISALATPAQTILYGRIFTKLSTYYIGDYNTFHDFIKAVGIYCWMIIVVGAAKSILTFFSVLFWMRNGETHQRRVRRQIFAKIIIQDNIEWVENFKNVNGEINQLNRCIEELRTGNAEVLGLMTSGVVGAVALFIVAMVFSWSVTLVVLALTPFFALSSWFTGKLAYRFANKENIYSAKSSKIINWCILNAPIPRVFNGKIIEILNFRKLVNQCSTFNYKYENVVTLNMGILRVLSLLMFVQAFWFGNTMIRLRKLNVNEVFTAFSACLMLAESVSSITELIGEIYRAQAANGRLVEFLNLHNSTEPDQHKMSPTWCNGSIEIKKVSFKYTNKKEFAIRDLNLNIKSNEFNFIIGKSGSGKSTISQLIMAFYKPDAGQILIDGLDVRTIDKRWISKNITLVSSNPIIFDHSLKDNLAMSVLDEYDSLDSIPHGIITEVCDFALLSKLIQRIGGVDQPISNSSVSGGEKQRISIARAKLRDTPILIIDEGLSALDQKNRITLLNSIRQWREGKTTIFITHQLDQIFPNDVVFIIQDGATKNQGYMRELSEEPLIKRTAIRTHSFSSGSSDESQDYSDSELKDDSVRVSQIKEYNYLKNPFVLKDVEALKIGANEKIYSLGKILLYYIKTANSKSLALLGLFFAAVHAVSNPIFSYIFSRLLENMIDISIGVDRSSRLRVWSTYAIACAIVNGATYFLANFLLAVSSEKWINMLRKRSLTKINDQDMSFFHEEGHKPVFLNALLMNDTRDLRTMVSKFLAVSISLTFLVLLGCIFALVLGWRLALTGIAFAFIIIVVSVVYATVLRKFETSYKDRVNDLETINFELVNGMKTVHSLNLKSFFELQFNLKSSALGRAASKRALHTGFCLAIKELLMAVATGVILYYGMRLVGDTMYRRLQFLQVITLLLMTFTAAGSLLNELPDITRGQRCATHIINLLKLPDSKVETEGTEKPAEVYKDSILQFSNIRFGYTPTKQVLKNVSFNIKEEDIFAIIGESGSGKSTITNLIMRLYGNYEGSIKLNGTEISQVNVEFLREYISIVPQNPVFFEGTIYDNLTYGLSKESLINSNVDEYLKTCNIFSFTNSLPDGLQSDIGSLTENSLISTGQLQRLAMARALIRQPKVLILDECTSNLDTQNFNIFKELILKANQEMGVTVIIVSHDTELYSIATKSINLSNGTIVN